MATTPKITKAKTRVCERCGESKILRNFVAKNNMYTDVCRVCSATEKGLELRDEAFEHKQAKIAKKQAEKRAKSNFAYHEQRRAQQNQYRKDKYKQKKQEAITAAARSVNAADRELAQRVLARRKLIYFIQRFKPDYEPGWVHEDICNRLERFFRAVENKESPRLILAMPPRHGKSEIASKNFPAWILGHRPEFEIIASSYNVSLPMGFSRRVKDLISSPSYKQVFPKTALSKTSQAAEAWLTTKGGGYVAAGVGGGITGKGAHIFIIDDPVKDAEEADSETMREKTWDWWGSTAKTRLAPGGGVLVIQCMTGDTPVLMADNTERPLRDIRPGDEIATYDNGVLSTSYVENWINHGCDEIYTITMSSGRIVKANERHPFLVDVNGEPTWVRLRDLKPTQKIVTLKDSGVNGKVKSAKQKGATKQSDVEDYVPRTTTKQNGPAGIAPLRLTPDLTETPTSNTATGSLLKTTIKYIKTKMGNVRYVSAPRNTLVTLNTGRPSSVLTTTTSLVRLGVCYATTATLFLRKILPLIFSKEQSPISDFTLDEVVSIEQTHAEDVYDIQVARTANFIANKLCCSNTRWHDDDLSGRMIMQMKEQKDELYELLAEAQERKIAASSSGSPVGSIQDEIDVYELELDSIDDWEVVSYPAIATDDEYEHEETHEIIQGKDLDGYNAVRVNNPPAGNGVEQGGTENGQAEPVLVEHDQVPAYDGYRMLRRKGEPLHDTRFPKARLINMKKSMQPRHWSALYQQNPVPDEGIYFTKGMFRYEPYIAVGHKYNIYIAWDLAIGEKQTNDYTVGAVIGVDYLDQIHVLDIIRGRWDSLGIVDIILDTAAKYDPQVVGIERGHLEMAIKPMLDKRMRERKQYTVFAEGKDALLPITDKAMRSRPLQGRMQQGMVIFPSNQPWVEQAVFELMRFPGGVHDDIVDALAWAVRLAMKFPPPQMPKSSQHKSWKDKLKSHIAGASGKHPMGA